MQKTDFEKKWYKPSEIAERGFIKNWAQSDNVGSNKRFIYNLIKRGDIQAKDYGKRDTPYYVISREEIIRWNKENG